MAKKENNLVGSGQSESTPNSPANSPAEPDPQVVAPAPKPEARDQQPAAFSPTEPDPSVNAPDPKRSIFGKKSK